MNGKLCATDIFLFKFYIHSISSSLSAVKPLDLRNLIVKFQSVYLVSWIRRVFVVRYRCLLGSYISTLVFGLFVNGVKGVEGGSSS